MMDRRPLIAHVVYRFDTGGLENGVVNLINEMDPAQFRHAVVALTQVTGFAQRIRRPDVSFVSLDKPPGQGLWQLPTWRRALAALRPDIVHTRNLGALEMQLPAALCGVKVRLHGEHGRDMSDPHGTRRRYQWIRRVYSPLVHRYVALSRDLADYLTGPVGIAPDRVSQIYNGVDTDRFTPVDRPHALPIPGCPFDPGQHLIMGTVGRLQAEKDQMTLVRALAWCLARKPSLGATLRLVVVGDGPLRSELEKEVQALGLHERVWMPGARSDIPDVLRGLHAFVLPSRAEGVSNTILEAMACGLPVLATSVGGNPELVVEGQTGFLVPACDPEAMGQAMLALTEDDIRRRLGQQARVRVEQAFSLRAMVGRYTEIYRDALAAARFGMRD